MYIYILFECVDLVDFGIIQLYFMLSLYKISAQLNNILEYVINNTAP